MPAQQRVLVVNAGSSSLKYQLVEPQSAEVIASGLIERIGEPTGHARHTVHGHTYERDLPVPDHEHAFSTLLQAFSEHGPALDEAGIVAVGHRVVHGGPYFTRATVLDDEVVARIEQLTALAPLHQPGNLEGIQVARRRFPDLPQVAVFDTAFHASIPPGASTYAVPLEWRDRFLVRRYGFHGTSHDFVSARTASLLGRPREETKVIVLHLGNGASACAVDGGRSVETSMGLSPLEGLVMGTRSGDIDASVISHLGRVAHLTPSEVDRALNSTSGLRGLTGTNDWRDVVAMKQAGSDEAQLAFDVVVHRLVKYVGAYAAVMGRLDALTFTAGIGEHSPVLRATLLRKLSLLGFDVDEQANAHASGERRITTDASAVAAFVIPTNEELAIARDCLDVLRDRDRLAGSDT